MTYDPVKHYRRSIRLKGYDYAAPGAYFVTIVTQGRECAFGEVVDGEMRLNRAGQVARREWERLPRRFPRVQLDAFVVMPNHVHGIIVITDDDGGGRGTAGHAGAMAVNDAGRGAACHTSTMVLNGAAVPLPDNDAAVFRLDDPAGGGAAGHANTMAGNGAAVPLHTREQFGKPVPGSIPTIVRSYKSATTLRINTMRATPGAPVWQRNYYEHIVRDDAAMERIRAYIAANPQRWADDDENPMRRRR